MKSTLLLFLLFSAIPIYSQTYKGKIIDELNRSIPFAHVYINEAIGTISNDSGYFNLTIPPASDSLHMSAIGYKPAKIAVKVLQEERMNLIRLQQYVQVLNTITVKSSESIDTAYHLMSEAIKKLYKNYPKRKYSYRVFYREASVIDTTFSRISEATALVSDPGYRNNLDDSRVQLLTLRKSADNRILSWRESLQDWLYKRNGLYRTLGHDRLKIKNRTYAGEYAMNKSVKEHALTRFFNQHYLNNTTFHLKNKFSYEEDTILQIIAKPHHKYFTDKAYMIINISKNDNAIIDYTSYVLYDEEGIHGNHKLREHKDSFEECYVCQSYGNRVINDSIYYYTHVKYKKHEDDKYYLNFISHKSISGTNSNAKIYSDFDEHYNNLGKAANIYIHNELYVTEILQYVKIKKRDMLDRKEEMHDLNAIGFFNVENLPMVVPLSSKMKNDLTENNNIFQQ